MGDVVIARQTILVVDDDAELREAMLAVVRAGGYVAVGAGEGEAALTLLREGLRPGLIVLDLAMPGMDGEAFLRLRMTDRAIASIPVVVCSGREDASPVAREMNAVANLKKPVDFDVLVRVVKLHCPAA